MAVELNVDNKRGNLILLWPEDITIRPEDNGRFVPAKYEKILASFNTLGQLQPVTIKREGLAPVLSIGFNRWKAAMKFNEGKPIELRMRLACVYSRASALEATLANIHENFVRSPLQPIDIAHQIAKLQDQFGKTVEEIAEAYDEDVKWVKKHLKLLNLTPEAQRALIGGDIKETAAEKIANLDAKRQKAAVANGGKIEGPVKPNRSKILMQLDLIASSTAHDKHVTKFAANFIKWMQGELDGGEL
jgi:ParB-like chromosome segregation protein Spo0J